MEWGGRGQGVPERSWEFMVFSLLILTRKNTESLTASLSCNVDCSPLFPDLHFPFLCILVVWTIEIQFCTIPFWAICFCEALSKRSHALLLSSMLFFSRDFFFSLTTKLFDFAHLSELWSVKKQHPSVQIGLWRLFEWSPFWVCMYVSELLFFLCWYGGAQVTQLMLDKV